MVLTALSLTTQDLALKWPWLMRVLLRLLRFQFFRNPASSVGTATTKSMMDSEVWGAGGGGVASEKRSVLIHSSS